MTLIDVIVNIPFYIVGTRYLCYYFFFLILVPNQFYLNAIFDAIAYNDDIFNIQWSIHKLYNSFNLKNDTLITVI